MQLLAIKIYYLLPLCYTDCLFHPTSSTKIFIGPFSQIHVLQLAKGKTTPENVRCEQDLRRHWFYYVRGISLPETKEKAIYTFCTRCHIYYHYLPVQLDSTSVSDQKSVTETLPLYKKNFKIQRFTDFTLHGQWPLPRYLQSGPNTLASSCLSLLPALDSLSPSTPINQQPQG